MGWHIPVLCKMVHLVLEENVIKEGSRNSMCINFYPFFINFYFLVYVIMYITVPQVRCIYDEGHAHNFCTNRVHEIRKVWKPLSWITSKETLERGIRMLRNTFAMDWPDNSRPRFSRTSDLVVFPLGVYQNLLEKSTVKSPMIWLPLSLSESEYSVETQQSVFLAECQQCSGEAQMESHWKGCSGPAAQRPIGTWWALGAQSDRV